MNEGRSSAAAVTLSMIAIVLSLIALFTSWVTYNKYGQDLQQAVVQELSKIQSAIAIEMAKLQARARLLAIEAEVKDEVNYEELALEASRIRQDLQVDYNGTRGKVIEEWQELDNSLELLEKDLKNKNVKAQQSLQGSLDLLERKIRVDN